jgi:hypothetical protein
MVYTPETDASNKQPQGYRIKPIPGYRRYNISTNWGT